MRTALANAIFRYTILFCLWNILKGIDPIYAEIPTWANLIIAGILGAIAGLSNIGEK